MFQAAARPEALKRESFGPSREDPSAHRLAAQKKTDGKSFHDSQELLCRDPGEVSGYPGNP